MQKSPLRYVIDRQNVQILVKRNIQTTTDLASFVIMKEPMIFCLYFALNGMHPL